MAHEQFDTVPILSMLSEEHKKAVIKIASIEDIPKGQELAREGETGDELFALLEGEVNIELIQAMAPGKSKRATLTTLYPGELFGEMVLLGRKRRVASVRANQNVKIAVWPASKLFKLFESQPLIGYRFMLALSCHLADRLETSNRNVRQAQAG